MGSLKGKANTEAKLGDLVSEVSGKIRRNTKTIRAAIDNLEVEGKVTVSKLPKSAIKIVKLIPED